MTTSASGTRERIHNLVETWARRAPSAPAVRFDGGELSYAELDRRANQFARHLLSLGVEVESRVVFCVNQSVHALVAILGTMKAGAAYVPVNPSYPRERVRFLIEDSGPRLVITESAHLHLFRGQDRLVLLDEHAATISGQKHQAPEVAMTGDNLAYVIYTSGSTGKPKGVLVQHRGACSLGEFQAEVYEVERGARVLQFASLSFDASVSEES